MHLVTDVQGNWHAIKGIIKQKWGVFTDSEIDIMEGKREKLLGSLMTKFGLTETDAEEQVSKFWSKE